MYQTSEKSCWPVTAWALATALGVGVLASVLAGSTDSAKIAAVSQAAD